MATRMPLTVTFDTGALNDVLWPETSQAPTDPADAARVRAAIEAGDIQGFFSVTLVTIEGIQRKDRAAVVGSTRLESESTSTGKNAITISIKAVQDRKPFDSEFSEMIQRAKSFRLRALRAPSRMGWVQVIDEDGTLFAPDASTSELLARMEKVNELATAISTRGLGYAKAVQLGRKYADCDNQSNPELWCKGLLKASHRQVNLALNEWADGDSIASHYGYAIGWFCSRDFGKNASGPSVLDDENRKWLNDTYGIRFVTLAELAKMVTP
jgi:hypothetical protein